MTQRWQSVRHNTALALIGQAWKNTLYTYFITYLFIIVFKNNLSLNVLLTRMHNACIDKSRPTPAQNHLKRISIFISLINLLTYLLTYSLHGAVLLEKLTGFQLVKKFTALYGNPKVLYRIHKCSPPVRNLRHSPGPRLSLWTFRNKICFYGEELLAPRPISKLKDHPLSAVLDYLFNIFAATLHIAGRSSIGNWGRAMLCWHGPFYVQHYSKIWKAVISVPRIHYCFNVIFCNENWVRLIHCVTMFGT